MLKGFKEFLSRGNIVDLSVAVVIGTAFTALVTAFTDSIIKPLVSSIGVNQASQINVLKIHITGDQYIDFNVVLSAAINFILVAAVVYFLVVLPYSKLRKQGEVEQADDAQVVLLSEIRDLLAQTNGSSSGRHGGSPAAVPLSAPPEYGPRAES
ncbi:MULTISPECIES: large-conductance mechanosensitive channel protein MscL [Mycobacterium]|uniref:Large-conductance mechanosensitive channel n=1 Tax=Mycobacterium gordonae TaxID=1778 RepID=A0A1A6BM54_MYCGO|nr:MULTISPECIES: large-conductance mechanosensitive channel protein MscL [Mycobacterium]MBI2702795.1 large-conductance mechanosensitive channel protein MscL [Mycobacterium sp.]MBX9982243.1 large-conductance mechanosensitive channel protein MscL [Mycobacterium gordonae]MCQ4359575.1 large-conductance mechanosensitive channel protein MscL [Mycobacterium gordonae]MCV7009143.1 large-conductance mechanosensitive channel protein MscL [Mycobacterium gordonae]OBS03381.1 mechanosensitive ion channel pro